MGQLDQEIANLLRPHEDAVKRLAEVPGLGVDSAQQIIAEVGPAVATFPSDRQLCTWLTVAPGEQQKRGRQLQPPYAEGYSPDAAHSQSSCQRCSEDQRK